MEQYEEEKNGRKRYHKINKEDKYIPDKISQFVLHSNLRKRIDFDSDMQHFTVFLLPGKMLIFPYNHIMPQPSYRADESGKIRMIEVSKKDLECPPDGRVVLNIEQEDIEIYLEIIRMLREEDGTSLFMKTEDPRNFLKKN